MRYYYSADRSKFFGDEESAILGELAKLHNFALEMTQRNAWIEQIRILKRELLIIENFKIYFEFSIPRMGKRADVVMVIRGKVFIIEFKIGSNSFDQSAIDQVEDYALDLKNFHETSHAIPIYPVLIPSLAKSAPRHQQTLPLDFVARPALITQYHLGEHLAQLTNFGCEPTLDTEVWEKGRYLPTPTIIQAAKRLYSKHGVEDITRHDAGELNLRETQSAIRQIIEFTKSNLVKSIIFVTGVPGAGKTLAGLNIAMQSEVIEKSDHATFLSGNGPLVDVLREALARDQSLREKVKKSESDRRVRNFIQNIHKFRDEYVADFSAPVDKVVIFDEAQRAWNRTQASKFMQTKRSITDFSMSEPEFLMKVMDRHNDWCTIICLVGGGQEINTGEAGISEWLNSLEAEFKDWKVFVSDKIVSPEYGLTDKEVNFLDSSRVRLNENLHLGISLRSFRAENLADFVFCLLEGKAEKCKHFIESLNENYPIFISRDLQNCKDWLRIKSRGSERSGLLASSGGIRLKPSGINVKSEIKPAIWFLNDKSDVRSSNYLEDVATEFDVQGLELDWTCVCWDANLRRIGNIWSYHDFKGTKWQKVRDSARANYLLNSYRVLLTRARQGMVIYLPEGDSTDYTRPPEFYDETFRYLKSCGIRELKKVDIKTPRALEFPALLV